MPDDEIVVGFALELLEPNEPDIRSIREQLRGFLGKSTQPFCRRLWELLLSAQEDPQGIPAELIELKRKELEEQRVCFCIPGSAALGSRCHYYF